MKNFRGFTLGLVLGLGIALSGLAFAQNSGDQNRKTDSCGAMASCCKGDSCAMKDGKNQSGKHECCCCGGDSCNMMDKKDMKSMKDMKNKPQ